MLGEPDTLDPYGRHASDLTYALIAPVFPMPYRMLPDGTVEPDLAESIETTTTGALLTLAEREWSNGRPITARDVVASIRRATPPSGFAAIEAAHVGGLRVVEMSGRVTDWEATLATAAFVLPRGRLIGGNVSGGPFRFFDYKPGRSIGYEKNPEAVEAPYLDRVKISFVQGTDLLIRLLEQGDIDAAAIPSSINLGTRLEEADITYDSAIGAERLVLEFNSDRVALQTARAVVAEIDRAKLVGSFIRDEGESLGSAPEKMPEHLPVTLSVGSPEGDELLALIQRGLQIDLEPSVDTIELITAPVSTVYGAWLREAPVDALLIRAIGQVGRGQSIDDRFSFPLASVATFIAWREEVHGIAVNPSLDGPLWNVDQWWLEPSI